MEPLIGVAPSLASLKAIIGLEGLRDRGDCGGLGLVAIPAADSQGETSVIDQQPDDHLRITPAFLGVTDPPVDTSGQFQCSVADLPAGASAGFAHSSARLGDSSVHHLGWRGVAGLRDLIVGVISHGVMVKYTSVGDTVTSVEATM